MWIANKNGNDSDLLDHVTPGERKLYDQQVKEGMSQTDIAKEENCTRANVNKKCKKLEKKLDILSSVPFVKIERELKNRMHKRDIAIVKAYVICLDIEKTAKATGEKLSHIKRVVKSVTSGMVSPRVRAFVKNLENNKKLLSQRV